MRDTIISLKEAVFQYSDGDRRAVDKVSLEVGRGEFLCILGRNGSGKSTLARLLNALLLPSSGEIWVDGIQATEENPFDVRQVCGMVFQNPDNQIVATVVEEDCAFGLENRGVEPKEIRKRVDTALEEVGMAKFAMTSPSMLSGGQKQRVAIAGVLAMRPRIIVFDESTAMLDPVGRQDIFNLARRINREEGVTIVWITHFMEEAVQADRVAVMEDGRLAAQGTPREVFAQVDLLMQCGLDVPEITKLAHRLRKDGLKLPEGILTVEEMAQALRQMQK